MARFSSSLGQGKVSVWAKLGGMILAIVGGVASAAVGAPGDLITSFPTVDGDISAAVELDGVIYLGGSFGVIGQPSGGFAAIDGNSGAVDPAWPDFDGAIHAMVGDGAGGWYVGGEFTRAGSLSRYRLAHIRADKSVDPGWDPGADDTVRAMAISPDGSTVYIGGSFATCGGAARNRVAAIDATSGTVTSWNPDANWLVYALKVATDGTVYVGGYFDTIGGQPRARIAAIDPSTGNATAWDPTCDTVGTTYVRAIVLSDDESTVYIAGRFQMVGGEIRQKIAAINAADGSVTAWDPGVGGFDAVVWALAVSGSTIYVGGEFTQIGGESRNNIAALDATTGLATAWDPDCNGTVYGISVSGSTVYAGGGFFTVGGEDRWLLAAIDADSGAPTSFATMVDHDVRAVVVADGVVYVGGYFTVAGVQRLGLAAVDAATGEVGDLDLAVDGYVTDIDASADGATLYVGGYFDAVGGQTRYNLASIDLASGTVTAWDPSISGGAGFGFTSPVSAMAVDGDTVYVGGDFDHVGTDARLNLAAIDASTGLALPWSPEPNASVQDLEIGGGNLYVAGYFDGIAGQTRMGVAAFRLDDCALVEWSPGLNGSVVDISIGGDNVYLAGDFTAAGELPRTYLVSVDALTATLSYWNPEPDGGVARIAAAEDAVYAGGSFTQINMTGYDGLALLDAVTGQECSGWNVLLDGQINEMIRVGDRLLVSGYFEWVNGQFRPNVAMFSTHGGPAAVDAEIGVAAGGSYNGTLQASGGSGSFEFSILEQPQHGTVTITNSSTGAYVYTAVDQVSGDSFTFAASDGCLAATGTVDVTFLAGNQTPVSANGVLAVNAGSTASGTLVASDGDGDALSYAIVTNGSKGSAVVTNAATGAYTYSAQANASGTDTFTFRASDGSADSNVATITVTIVPAVDESTRYTLTTAVTPEARGTIARTPDAESYASGTVVTLTAVANAGSRLARWSGDASGVTASTTVVMDANKSVQASFVAEQSSAAVVVATDAPTSLTLSDPELERPVAGLTFSSSQQTGNVVMNLNREGEAHGGVYVGFAGGQGLSRSVNIHSDLQAGTFVALLQLDYSPDELAGLDETQLRLFRWNDAEETWKLAAANDVGVSEPTGQLGDHGVDIVNHRVWAIVDHFSEFGIGQVAVAGIDDTAETTDESADEDELPADSEEVPMGCGACGSGVPLCGLLGIVGFALMRRRR